MASRRGAMRRHAKGSVLDLSIRGDELENRRIQLEHDLQRTAGEFSFRLSSVSDDEEGYHNQSVEYPRHESGPISIPDFASFEHASRDHFDETHSQIHPYSYRTDDNEGGIYPYIGGETMSTAAHHASALTLSAGLGGRGVRRDISLSGAEYDPDRPLQAMIAGVDSKLSMFDIEPSRSRYPGVSSVTFDPLVVDTTAELDRILQSGYAVPPDHMRIHSPLHSSSSSSDSEHAKSPTITRPKLSDSLRKSVTFSPKRPRSAQSNPSEVRHRIPISSPLSSSRHKLKDNEHGAGHSAPQAANMPTPKPKKRASVFPSHPASPGPSSTGGPQVRLHPPTPSSAGSQFSKMARGLVKEIQQEEHQARKSSGSTGKYQAQTPRGKVHLPDVTGLTSAVESPAKTGMEYDYYPYRADDSPREIEARLIMTLNTVQSKLQQLEEENGISRRRVRELEMELDICKRDVARERTRVLEREEIIVQQQRDVKRNAKGKAKATMRDVSINISADRDKGRDLVRERYKEVVEEKKALEALIITLRSHLTRLTSELSSHKELLMSLRELRESDVRALNKKSEEIEKLKEKVERLAGEIEVLRGVVEEGLKERREGREVEATVRDEEPDLAMSHDAEVDEEEEDEHRMDERRAGCQEEVPSHQGEEQWKGEDNEGEENLHDEEPEPFDPASIQGSSRNGTAGHEQGYGFADKTMRTDRATLGSSKLAQSTAGFIDPAEYGGMSVELEERRSHHSYGNIPPPSPSLVRARRTAIQVDVVTSDDDGNDEAPPTPRSLSSSRPTAPTPARAQESTHLLQERRLDETPFPQIRGSHLERLFFSAPEHNERTCNVCRRRVTSGYQTAGEGVERSWIPSRFRQGNVHGEGEDEDEGFAEGSEHQYERERRRPKGKRPQHDHVTFLDPLDSDMQSERWQEQAKEEGLPPQTVVARVIRELEDDFTHYKGIYVELADQYKFMDAVSDVPRRNVLAKHLKEVVDILEQKGDQIASLYDLLTFKDKDVPESVPVAASTSKLRSVSTTAVPSSSIGRKAGGASKVAAVSTCTRF